jgi:integrase
MVMIGGRELSASNPEAADLLRDSHLSAFPVDPETGEPVGVPEIERRALNLLANGGRLARPAPTIADAKRLYIRERIKGDINETAKTQRLERVMAHLAHAIEESRPLSDLTREDAREVRDHMLRDLNMNPATVRRYMNDIRAVISLGLTEFGLSEALNPFLRLPIKLETVARDERLPIPDETLTAIRSRLSGNAGAELWLIWRMVEGTGCRLGEITGALVSDLLLDAPIPYLNLVHHPHRRLKNDASVRRVPLIGEALEAAKEAVKAAGPGPFLFQRYGRVRGSDAASAALMKHVRAITDNPKIAVHSLRHTMEDRLSRARIDEFDRNLILGHTRGSMSERYGGPDARLEAAAAGLKAALDLAARGKKAKVDAARTTSTA